MTSQAFHVPGAIGPVWVDPGKSRSLSILTLLIAIGLSVIWGLHVSSTTQKIAPYPSSLLGFSLLMYVLSFVLFVSPKQATVISVIGMFGAMLFVMSTVYRALFHPAESPYLSMWYIGASHAYVLILQIVTFAIFQRGAVLLSSIIYVSIFILICVHCIQDAGHLPVETITPMVTLTFGPLASMFGLNFLVRWRNEASRRELLMQQEKEKLMAMVSHEIRGQLQTTLSTGELLATKVTDPMGRRALSRLTQVTLQLDRYLRDWMEFVRLDNPELSIVEKPINLLDLVDQIIEEFHSEFIKKGLVLSGPMWSTLESSALIRLETVQTDAVRLKQVLSNLISNALKYTQAGSVRVNVVMPAEPPHHIAISVTDTGHGIAPDQLKLIFEPFMRLGHQQVNSVEGSGLGLAIASRLMQRMGGKLEASSNPDAGTCFTVLLPLKNRR
jgi:signal transduction histidine kinase